MDEALRERTSARHGARRALGTAALLLIGVILGAAAAYGFHELRSPPVSATSNPAGPVALASAGYGLDAPTAAAVVGDRLFVVNQAGDSVTVVDSRTGAHVTTLAGPSFGFDQPTAIAAVGQDLFVANGADDSVTEVDGAGLAEVRVLSGPQYAFSSPVRLVGSTREMFVLSADGAITGFSPATGGVIGILGGARAPLRSPSDMALGGDRLYVADPVADAVAVVDAGTLSTVTVLNARGYRFARPTGVAITGRELWVTNAGADSVTEVSLTSERVIRVIVDHTNLPTPGPIAAGDSYVFTLSPPGDSPMVSQIVPSRSGVAWMMCNNNGSYLLNEPEALALSGPDLWVVNKGGDSLTEMDADSGDLIRTVS